MARGSAITDPALAELVRVKNYKQALKNIDKKFKKQASDIRLLALKADLLLKNGDLDDSHKLCVDLLARDEAAHDLEIVQRLDDTARDLSANGQNVPSAHVEKLWQSAVKVHNPNSAKLEIAEDWAEHAIQNCQWASVSKAAALLAKLLPESDARHRKYFFWQILAHWLSRPDANTTDERMRTLGQTMANRMLEKAVQQTPKSPKEISPSTSQQSILQRQEFDLMASIFRAGNKETDVVSAVSEKGLDEHSSPAVDDWGTRRTRIDLLISQDRYQEAWNTCHDMFDSAQKLEVDWRSDDWASWDQILRSSQTPELTRQLEKLALSAKDRMPSARAPAIAAVEASNRAMNLGLSSTTGLPPIVSEAKEYFDKFSSQNGCASEIDDMLRGISDTERQQFRSSIDSDIESSVELERLPKEGQLKWISREVNVLRLDYKWYLSDIRVRDADQAATKRASETLRAFICSCLKLYHTSKQHTASLPSTDIYPGDEACIMGVKALVKLQEMTGDRICEVYGAILLTSLLEDSRHNANGRVMLINLLLSLGIPIAAMSYYQDLRVRQILVESCAPVIFNGISAMLPFRLGTTDFYKVASEHLKFFNDALIQIPRYQMTAMNSENYTPAIEFHTFGLRLCNSPTRRMLRQERIRMARFRLMSCNEEGLGFDTFAPQDSINEASSMDPSESSTPEWALSMESKLLGVGPALLQNNTLYLQEQTQRVISLVFSVKPPRSEDLNHLKAFQTLAMSPTRDGSLACAQLTHWEQIAMSQASQIASVLLALFDYQHLSKQETEQRIVQALSELHKGIGEGFPSAPPPSTKLCESWPLPPWEFYHATYTELECLMAQHKLVVKATSHCKTTLKLSSQALKDVTRIVGAIQGSSKARYDHHISLCQGLRDDVYRFAVDSEAASRLLEAGREDEHDIGEAIEMVIGMPNIKRTFKRLTDAANEGLKGFDMVKLA